ncbi:class I SAM-dependent methyltransferase [Streptomyces sp. NPDC004051]
MAAIDLAEENAAPAARRIRERSPECPVVVWQGTLLALPYPDATFDVVWCANTVQYLDDTELAAARTELRRVIRLGGTVAVKDLDTHLITLRPGDPYLFTDFFRVSGAGPGYARRQLRFRELCHWMRRAGFTDVRQRTVLIEHHAPLTPSARAFCTAACARGPVRRSTSGRATGGRTCSTRTASRTRSTTPTAASARATSWPWAPYRPPPPLTPCGARTTARPRWRGPAPVRTPSGTRSDGRRQWPRNRRVRDQGGWFTSRADRFRGDGERAVRTGLSDPLRRGCGEAIRTVIRPGGPRLRTFRRLSAPHRVRALPAPGRRHRR